MFASISVTTFNRKKLSKFCIETIRDRTPRSEYELVVVDNGSTDGTVSMLKKFKAEGTIDKLILNHPNSLGMAINDAWKKSSFKAEWLIVLSNDMFCIEGWLENLKLIIRSNLKPEYVFCALRMPGFRKRVPYKTKNGGSFVVKQGRWRLGYPFGGGLAVRRQTVFKHNIRFIEKHRIFLRRSIYTGVCRELHKLKLRCVELGKPCLLFQDSEFNNPAYSAYYKTRFGINDGMRNSRNADRVRKFELLKKNNYTRNPEVYYEGSDYKVSKYYRR